MRSLIASPLVEPTEGVTLPTTRSVRSPVGILLVTSGVSLVILLVALVGLVADDRFITGAPAWLKPLKFAVSIAVYCATLAWLLSLVVGHTRLVRVVAWTTGGALVLELVVLVTQVGRGTTRHFNLSTALDANLFSAMAG